MYTNSLNKRNSFFSFLHFRQRQFYNNIHLTNNATSNEKFKEESNIAWKNKNLGNSAKYRSENNFVRLSK